MKQAIIILILLVIGTLLARYHVANQSYYPVSKLTSAEGYTFVMVQDRTAERSACGKANDRFLEPVKARCVACDVIYARCERELQGLEYALLMGDAVPMYVVTAPGMRLGMEGPKERVGKECEQMAAMLVQRGHKTASCAFPGTLRTPWNAAHAP
jgi:hypothetical protein